MSRLLRLTPVWLGLIALAVSPLRADGPHWHVPNPDGEDEQIETSVDNENGQTATPKVKVERPAPGARTTGGAPIVNGLVNKDYMTNPGDFLKMDKPCVDYYERHSVIQHATKGGPGGAGFKAANDKEFYLLIMNRCAQAMREVDSYLPCPDSFPLWHTEELRELMLVYAERTWVRSTSLSPELAKACGDFCVQCYVDTVRFREPSNKPAFDATQKLHELLEKYNEAQGAAKTAIWDQCKALMAGKISTDMIRVLSTFKMITGDIPPQIDEAEARMMLALVKMGSAVIPALQNAMNNPNPDVRRAVATVIDMIGRRFRKPEMLEANMSNVIQLLRDMQTKPGSMEAQNAAKILKNMGTPALPILIRVAESETLDLKPAAQAGLQAVSGKSFGADLKRWKEYVDGLGENKK